MKTKNFRLWIAPEPMPCGERIVRVMRGATIFCWTVSLKTGEDLKAFARDWFAEWIATNADPIAALKALTLAGEQHMAVHPSEGAKFHESNAAFYKALGKARRSIQVIES